MDCILHFYFTLLYIRGAGGQSIGLGVSRNSSYSRQPSAFFCPYLSLFTLKIAKYEHLRMRNRRFGMECH